MSILFKLLMIFWIPSERLWIKLFLGFVIWAIIHLFLGSIIPIIGWYKWLWAKIYWFGIFLFNFSNSLNFPCLVCLFIGGIKMRWIDMNWFWRASVFATSTNLANAFTIELTHRNGSHIACFFRGFVVHTNDNKFYCFLN